MSARISRPMVALLALGIVAAIMVMDLATAGAPDLFTAPSAFALGSGAAPTGAHCTGS